MEKLRLLLSDTSEKDLQTLFQTVANELMCNHIIQKGERQYEIVEIEFYYYSPEHRDVITYPRDMQAGRWFFHQSGVDITFASQGVEKLQDGKFRYENAHFGGVLIRGLRRRSDGEYIFGPLKCTYELWDHFDAFGILSANEYPILKEHQGVVTPNLRACKRCINIKKEKKEQETKIAEWAGRIGLDWKQADIEKDIENYAKDLFEDSNKYLYRYFNLPNYESEMLKNIPSNARPKDII